MGVQSSAIRDRHEMVNLLLPSGADANSTDVIHRTSLHEASRKGYFELVEKMLLSRFAVDLISGHPGVSAVGEAFREGHSPVVEVFIEMELKGELFHQHGGSLLHVACKEREIKMGLLRRLLVRGVDATKRDDHQKLPVDYVNDEQMRAEVFHSLSFVTHEEDTISKEEERRKSRRALKNQKKQKKKKKEEEEKEAARQREAEASRQRILAEEKQRVEFEKAEKKNNKKKKKKEGGSEEGEQKKKKKQE